jgi:uncharacterized repeat protein (TIGR03803 family)
MRRTSFVPSLSLALVLSFLASSTLLAQGYRKICQDQGVLPNELTQGSDGTFYGTYAGGGNNLAGVVFKMDASCTTTILHTFGDVMNDGQGPRGGLLLASDGFLYGTTASGGSDGNGTVFKIDTDGNNYSFTSIVLVQPGNLCPPTGIEPWCAPFQASDGNIYTSMENCGPGGANGSSAGTVASITPGLVITGLSYFDPLGAATDLFYGLAEGPDHMLYGTAIHSDDIVHYGAVYKVPLGGGDPVIVHAFSRTDGAYPDGPVTFDTDGNIWGGTTLQTDDQGNGIAQGTLFKISGGGLTTIHSFTDAEGMITESGGVTQGSDGKIYGVTRGTTGFNGFFFRTDVDGNYEVLASVPDTELLYVPYRSFYKGLDGKLYGQTQSGGGSTYYTIDTTQWIDSIAPASGPVSGGTPVTITGAGFVSGATVDIGGIPATNPNVPDATHVTADTPGGKTAGTAYTVKVRLPDGTVILLNQGWFADFLDVPPSDPFHDFIESVARAGITAGCGGGNYCRNSPVTRAQMAVFLEKAKRGAAFVPPSCAGTFPDVPCSSPFAPWIEQLAADGITGGCGGGNFCPDSPVLRQQMSVFLLKGEHGSAYVPPSCTGVFDDVPCTPGTGFSDWIEQLVAEAITGGCQASPPLYCPTNPVTRGQMGVFLTKTFALP